MDLNTTLAPIVTELLRLLGSLLAAIVGGGLVILATWIADRRRRRAEEDQRAQRERTLLTGMYAVRNHIANRLNAFDDTGRLSELERMRTAQAYVRRFVEATPDGTEGLMIAVLEIGLKLDALLGTLDKAPAKPTRAALKAVLPVVVDEANELLSALHQFDAISMGSLAFVDDEDLRRWGALEAMFDETKPPPAPTPE